MLIGAQIDREVKLCAYLTPHKVGFFQGCILLCIDSIKSRGIVTVMAFLGVELNRNCVRC